jgi:hypothetical protein
MLVFLPDALGVIEGPDEGGLLCARDLRVGQLMVVEGVEYRGQINLNLNR